MYYFLSVLSGILVSLMVAVNGGLALEYGLYSSNVIIHIVGLILISALVAIKRERPFEAMHPWFLYLGGVIGVGTVVFTNMAFGRISVSAILALGLLGQGVSGLVVDQFGWMGMPRHPFRARKLIGLLLILLGIFSMLDRLDAAAVAAFAAGITVLLSRTINARLAGVTSIRISTLYNYITGLGVAVIVYLLLGTNEQLGAFSLSPEWYIYTGGVFGVCLILMTNILVIKISAFYLSLFVFVGQVFTGILVDAVISRAFSAQILLGGVLVTAGLIVNLLLDRKPVSPFDNNPVDNKL